MQPPAGPQLWILYVNYSCCAATTAPAAGAWQRQQQLYYKYIMINIIINRDYWMEMF